MLSAYFEIKASINVGKPTPGPKSSAYIVFDCQSPIDFRFAKSNVSNDKLEMGLRGADQFGLGKADQLWSLFFSVRLSASSISDALT